MASSRDIKRRIKSVKNISQITKAMELVAAAKMKKAQEQTKASRPYAQLSSALLKNLSHKSDNLYHPLLSKMVAPSGVESQKVLAILISSNKGLTGALNTNLFSKANELLKSEAKEKFDVVTVGKKSSDAARRLGLNIIASFEGKDKNITIIDAKPIAQVAIDDYLSDKYEKVFVIYTDFISTLLQKPNILQVLPLTSDETTIESLTQGEYIFEPNSSKVFDKIIISTIEFIIYQSLVEASASEHSARMVAMKNASTAANDLIDDLSLTYNQARQAGLTKELSEISAAKLAMEG
jgi:F-type H+-transporting ATPase subunit gamma